MNTATDVYYKGPVATHMVRCADNPMRNGPTWSAVSRSRRKLRKYDHWIFTHARTGELRYFILARETLTHWHVYVGRSHPKAGAPITRRRRLCRKLWSPTWMIIYTAVSDEGTAYFDA